jgi:putative membrane protein
MTTTVSLLATHAHGWGPRPWWPLLWLLFWSAIVAAAVWWTWRRRLTTAEPDARAVLTGRYARGEIDDDEYRHRLAVLEEKAR